VKEEHEDGPKFGLKQDDVTARGPRKSEDGDEEPQANLPVPAAPESKGEGSKSKDAEKTPFLDDRYLLYPVLREP